MALKHTAETKELSREMEPNQRVPLGSWTENAKTLAHCLLDPKNLRLGQETSFIQIPLILMNSVASADLATGLSVKCSLA